MWTAIGFPVTDPEARTRFYDYSNWCYQVGVFFSRSSPMLLPQVPPLPDAAQDALC